MLSLSSLSQVVAIDTETTGLDLWHGDSPFCVGFHDDEGRRISVHWTVDPWTRTVLPVREELEEVADFLQDRKRKKIFHHAKFDTHMFKETFGISVEGEIHDTAIAAHVVNTKEPSYKLKDLTNRYLKYPLVDVDRLKSQVVRCRRIAKIRGWALGGVWKGTSSGDFKYEASVEADYWMPKALNPNNRLCQTYCENDCERTLLLHMFLQIAIEERGLQEAYQHEIDLWPVVFQMEERGMYIDRDRLAASIVLAREEQDRQLKIVRKYAKRDLNLKSPKQLGTFLFSSKEKGGLGIQPVAYTETGMPAVDQESLDGYVSHPFVEALLRYRSTEKAITTYFMTYANKGVPLTGTPGLLIHCNLNQTGPSTGRFSCTNPNLQNVTSSYSGRGHYLVQARGPFGPRPGYTWYSIDYSQLEVRIFADLGNVSSMLDAIRNGRDIHRECADKAWGGKGNPAAARAALQAIEWSEVRPSNVDIEALWKEWGWKTGRVPKDEGDRCAMNWLKKFNWSISDAEKSIQKKNSRSRAKLLVFTKIFGGGPPAVSKLLKCSREDSIAFLREFDVAFPEIEEYIKKTSSLAKRRGYIMTQFGRRLVVQPEKAYRAINYQVQGSAAGLLKKSLVDAANYLDTCGKDAHIVMCIHDEIMFEIRNEHATRRLLQDLCRIMEDHGGAFSIPTPVEVEKVVSSWNEKQKASIGDWR